mmetsp:Transcript_67388/g.146696  ORF Transcript_67388/g.146696 Transcript_67388/m.146696 type:complete len:175 (-) Transcript_67388:190-714(-)
MAMDKAFLYGAAGTCAAIVAGAQVSMDVPVSKVPITGQTLATATAGLLVGPWAATAGAAGYIVMAALGCPILAHHKTEVSKPSWGFVLGFAACTSVTGVLGQQTGNLAEAPVAATIGQAATLACGAAWVVGGMGVSLQEAFETYVVPFLPGLAIKSLLTWAIVAAVRQQQLKVA